MARISEGIARVSRLPKGKVRVVCCVRARCVRARSCG
jgi:hypothetical protein